ncbi:uncharacterized protein LOC132049270 [Lycium ferocissimum]|uniref:uncharacterized protein LOC132049270 n=1 Tax=Lycium ferocissimum TaxID=112874 RepID=UPI002815732B|nr:uncharacterized protein LOC132049270 [Lycium ferocissimum]
MRIRKRFPPPSLDLQVNRPVVVQQNTKNESLPSDLPNLTLPQPSDQPVVTGGKATRWVFFGGNSNQEKQKNKDVEAEEDEKLWREKKESFGSSNDNDNKKEISFLTPQLGSLLPQPSSSSDLDARWCEGEHKVIPFKKRRPDSYHHTSNINTMKSKTNKKCPQENGNEEQEQEHYGLITEEGFESNINSDHKVGHVNKKSKRGSVILEGSRCSRVNGRGWRCCQQTLVGYSLCEHHLGKGRLRSMNSVRNATNKKKQAEKEEKSSPNDHEYYGTREDDKKKSLMVTKKKKMKRIGMVKARSLSSLLGQTDNAVAAWVVDNDNKNK